MAIIRTTLRTLIIQKAHYTANRLPHSSLSQAKDMNGSQPHWTANKKIQTLSIVQTPSQFSRVEIKSEWQPAELVRQQQEKQSAKKGRKSHV